ncbi:MAG: hypothetical protein DRN78_05715 [Thermoproteota archaeon]|nr:MAG: hypothetical protein DRN78_05715 [Candidatus Korarchaeota archaeon]
MGKERVRKIREKLKSKALKLAEAFINPVPLGNDEKPIIFNDEWYRRPVSDRELKEIIELIDHDETRGLGVVTGLYGLVAVEVPSITYEFLSTLGSVLFMVRRTRVITRAPISYTIFFFVPRELVDRISVNDPAILHVHDIAIINLFSNNYVVANFSFINLWETYYDFTPDLSRINTALKLIGLRLKVQSIFGDGCVSGNLRDLFTREASL